MLERKYTLQGIALTLIVVMVAAGGILFVDKTPAQAPYISFSLLNGNNIAMSDLKGKTVIVNFWASSCIDCRREIPHLASLYHEYANEGLEIIGVAMPYDPPNRVLESSQRMNIPYPIALDIDGIAVDAFGKVRGTPTTILISPSGEIIARHEGVMDINTFRKRLIAENKAFKTKADS